MAKGFLAGLKGIDAFGKVIYYLYYVVTRRLSASMVRLQKMLK